MAEPADPVEAPVPSSPAPEQEDPREDEAAQDSGIAQGEDDNQDAVSIKTTTEALFAEGEAGDTLDDPAEKQHRIGLDINYPWGWHGSMYDDYDVVTVHGIRDDFRTAWTDHNGGWWVKDQLFKDLSIREVDYSYDIHEDSMLYEPSGIKSLALDLLSEFAQVRQRLDDTETDRPIIWICHDVGGQIVKMALSLAMEEPAKYGKISILTTAIFFLGTAHRFESRDDLEDQLLKLVLLPGPEIRHRLMAKVHQLANQVDDINKRFLATKLFDRAAIFNLFSQNVRDSLVQVQDGASDAGVTNNDDEDLKTAVVTPFPRYAHFVGHSFEAAGRRRWSTEHHLNLVSGDPTDYWLGATSEMFNQNGCAIKVNYRILHLQARLLSLAPPTRALDTRWDPCAPQNQIVQWIWGRDAFTSLKKPGKGARLMHLHGNGNPAVDIKEVSRLFYADEDPEVTWNKNRRAHDTSIIYFEFDQRDSRYNSISSLLVYLINELIWHFWENCPVLITLELAYLDAIRAWTPEDLYHVFTLLRDYNPSTHGLTLFISCFDQCPEDQRRWFLEYVLEEQNYCEAEYRLVLSSSTRDGLAVESFPEEARVNLEECPVFATSGEKTEKDLSSGLADLIARRPVFGEVRSQLESLLEGCASVPHLGHISLAWLARNHRGKPKSAIAEGIKRLSPSTAANLVELSISSMLPTLQRRASTAFNWIKHAAEPWSPESLAEALTVFEFHGEEPSFEDLDINGMIRELEEGFGGIITTENHDIKFSHPSFYDVPEVGIEGSADDRAAQVNSELAETCLRYFQLAGAQKWLAHLSPENLDGGPWASLLDAAPIAHFRTSMAEYAVRFWPQHYQASAHFRPRSLVDDLFASRDARASWEVPFWLLSNSFTRLQRSYISTLPVFAMLGLEDLVDEQLKSDVDQPCFTEDCWLAITEAARAGNKGLVQRILGSVEIDEEQLGVAILWAAAAGDAVILNELIERIPNMEAFSWQEGTFLRAATAGLDDLITAMLLSGWDINEGGASYGGLTPVAAAIWRNRTSTVESLLSSAPAPDLTIPDDDGDSATVTAALRGHPQIINAMVQGGADVHTRRDGTVGLTQIAVEGWKHEALRIFIKAGAEFQGEVHETEGPPNDDAGETKPALVIAASEDSRACVRILLDSKADVNSESGGGTALYKAVENGHVDIARLLLEHDPKPDMTLAPPGEDTLLMCAVNARNHDLVSLLLEHGAEVNFIEPNESDRFNRTPLSRACWAGDSKTARLLREHKADVNYTEGKSDAPIFAAIWAGHVDLAKELLEDETADVTLTGEPEGMGFLHASFNKPDLIQILLKKGAPIDAQCMNGTPLHMAARGNEIKVVEALLASEIKPDLEYALEADETNYYSDESGFTALQVACANSAFASIKLLLKAGADPRRKSKNGDDALGILVRSGLLGAIDWTLAEECLKLLISEPHATPVDQVDDLGRTLLHRIQETTSLSVVEFLVQAKAPFDRPDQSGYTPLAMAITRHNQAAAEYLIKMGANTDAVVPGVGSILHLAVKHGNLDVVKLLIESGAECRKADVESGESLVYTALKIADKDQLKEMLRYLVDEAKLPIDQMGGKFGYPIIEAASMAKLNQTTANMTLKFLIRRNAPLNVADSQGRRAVHLACRGALDTSIRILTEAGAEIDVKDNFGRRPMHFAATSWYQECFMHVLLTSPNMDVNVVDHSNWTPLMWAARSARSVVLHSLLTQGADVWVRGHGYGAEAEWSALKLWNFSDRDTDMGSILAPQERTRTKPNGEIEEWEDSFHEIRLGDRKNATCMSCLEVINGIQWRCVDCFIDTSDETSLCFKCYELRPELHDPKHSFEEIEPLFLRSPEPSIQGSTASRGEDQENPGKAAGGEEEGQTSASGGVPAGNGTQDPESPAGSDYGSDDFDPDA